MAGEGQGDRGEIQMNGKAITKNSPGAAKQLGIAAIYQQPALFPELSVAENIAIGLEEASLWTRVDWGHRRRRAAELLSRIGAKVEPEADAGNLTLPQQKLVAIARTLGADAQVLIRCE